MPEGPEVYKLARHLDLYWKGTRISRFTAPADSPNPKKYVKGVSWPEFTKRVKGAEVSSVWSYGKMIYVALEGEEGWVWCVHLSSTGWFVDPNFPQEITDHFIHQINEKSCRMKVHLLRGEKEEVWEYHDPRTWGTWTLQAVMEDGAGRIHSVPDWMWPNPGAGIPIDKLRELKTNRTVKAVLTDQKIAKGIGNYIACEVAFRAGIHPLERWGVLSESDKERLFRVIPWFLIECVEKQDHSHWAVFKRLGQRCVKCETKIAYRKDSKNSARGSYFCPTCQPQKECDPIPI